MNRAKLKQQLERNPRLYLWLLSIKRIGHWSRRWLVTKQTDITIDGYPRSGNSFARSAFETAQDRKYRVATHVHSYAQVLRSVELDIPTMVLLREPKDACLSLVALTYEIEDADLSKGNLKRAKRHLLQNLLDYAEFYRQVATVKDGVIIAEFSVVTHDYGEVLRRMNKRFGTSFKIYTNSEENDQEVFKDGGFHLSPNETRNTIKEYLSECLQAPDVKALVDQAHGIFEHIVSIEQEQAKLYGSELVAN
ncbi:hypothetical protein [Coraliomargarita parva]|uniref:hypothetical protein n=1 Tax=Coraliomargarita parva TaxID=3014050 RepID=UPI0022B3AFDD|nr:hypothetical protein [Coraliomargarita parva]